MQFSGCGSVQPIGGQADTFIDFLLNEVQDKKFAKEALCKIPQNFTTFTGRVAS